MWNISKENGWKQYKEVSEIYSEKFEKIVDDKTVSLTELIEKFEKMNKNIKFEAFGKVTIRNRSRKTDKMVEDKNETEEERAKALYEEQEKIVNEELEDIKGCKNGRAGRVWQIRKRVVGGKKEHMKPNAIRNPDTGKLEVKKKGIKEVTLRYCIDTLASNKPEEEFNVEIDKKKVKVKELMKNKDGQFKPTKETFDYTIEKFKRKGKKNYFFITRAGDKYKEIV